MTISAFRFSNCLRFFAFLSSLSAAAATGLFEGSTARADEATTPPASRRVPAEHMPTPDASAIAPETMRMVDKLLDEAVSHPPERTEKRALPAEDVATQQPELPRTPSEEALLSVINVVIPAVRGCAPEARGRADLSVLLQSDGHVVSARVTGPPFAGSASGRCMEGILRRVRFPAFQERRFRVQIPFLLQ